MTTLDPKLEKAIANLKKAFKEFVVLRDQREELWGHRSEATIKFGKFIDRMESSRPISPSDLETARVYARTAKAESKEKEVLRNRYYDTQQKARDMYIALIDDFVKTYLSELADKDGRISF